MDVRSHAERAHAQVLVVDDDESMCELIASELAGHGHVAACETHPERALSSLRSRPFDVVVTDLQMAAMNGVELCERIVAEEPDLPVVLLTAHGTLEAAVAALRVRAFDFLAKPPDIDGLVAVIERALRHRRLTEELDSLSEDDAEVEVFEGIIGSSPPMRELVHLIGRVAAVDAAVLIRGESGTGKELVARALHERSRRSGPFVALNCAALPENLIESELFGHVKGAFTDARADHAGLLERAHGGTIFLDEIGDLHLALQPKLLRALQERTVRPVGSHRETEVDVRVITATNVDLAAAVEARRFREDLYYRLNVIEIVLPPLRERGRDVLLLAQHLVERSARAMQREVTGLTASCAARLMAYPWPGNVRELANVIERAVALSDSSRLTVDDLPPTTRAAPRAPTAAIAGVAEQLLPLEEVERQYIRRVMAATGGNKTLAAQILGVDRRTLYRRDWAAKTAEARRDAKRQP